MRGYLSASVCCTAVVIATSSHVPATAQSVGASVSDADIVVTARRVEERLLDVPVSVSVIGGEQIAQQNIVNATDLAVRIPSLQSSNSLGSVNSTFTLRGFNQEAGAPPSVGVYFADVVALRGFANTFVGGDGAGPGSFFDLQNIQVLKGPQGTLFGRNTTGGAVLLTPKRPQFNFEGYVEGSYGSYDMKRLQGVINIPLSDIAAFRIGGDYMDRKGYLRNTTGVGPRDFNDVGYFSLRASLLVNLTPDIENYTVGQFSKVDQNGDLQQLYAAFPAVSAPLGILAQGQLTRAAAEGNDGYYDIQNGTPNAGVRQTAWQLINTTTWDVSDNVRLKNIISYGQLRQLYNGGPFATYADLSAANGFLAGIRRPAVAPNTFVRLVGGTLSDPLPTLDQDTFTEEFRIEGNAFNQKIDYQIGAYLEKSSPLGTVGATSRNFLQCSSSFVCANPSGIGLVSISGGRLTFRNIGIFAQSIYHVTDRLNLTTGIRYTWDRVRSSGSLPRYVFPISSTPVPFSSITCGLVGTTPPSCTLLQKKNSSAPTWVLSLDYKPTDNLMAYAKWSRGYRAGGVLQNTPPPLNEYEQEKLETYEVGMKFSQGGSFPLNLNVAAYYNDFSNQLILNSLIPTVAGLSPLGAPQNTGKSRIYGLEVEGSVSPFRGFRLNAGYAYINAKIEEVNAVTIPPGFNYRVLASIRPGDRPQNTPEHKVSLTGQYDLPVSEDTGKITVGLTYTYTGDMVNGYSRRNAAGKLNSFSVVAARTVLDANLDWKKIGGSPIDLSLFVTNLTDKKYAVYQLDQSFAAFRQLAPPRMYGGRVRYSF